MNNNIIDEIYNDNNFPSLDKLYKLVKSDHPKITKNRVKDFLDNVLGEQLLKTTRKTSRKKQGTITANYENENCGNLTSSIYLSLENLTLTIFIYYL